MIFLALRVKEDPPVIQAESVTVLEELGAVRKKYFFYLMKKIHFHPKEKNSRKSRR